MDIDEELRNELVNKAMKHGFDKTQKKCITIKITPLEALKLSMGLCMFNNFLKEKTK